MALGAHEVLDLHEVLTAEIDAINMMQLLKSHIRDQQLSAIVGNQLDFVVHGYNTLVSVTGQTGMQQLKPYHATRVVSPTYGLHQPQQISPQMTNTMNAISDRDVASMILGIHKSGALKKMQAALECADPHIRRTLQQSANNCGELAYEVWNYMNQQGYYQVPKMQEFTTEAMTHLHRPTAAGAFYTTGDVLEEIPYGMYYDRNDY